MSFKENLQYLRGSRNMTQEQLAMLLGVSRQAISKWESEKAYPEMDKLLMLCDMFGVTLDDLVMGDVRASAGCGGAGRVDLAADTDGVAASVGVADAAVGAVPGVIGFAASQVAGMSDSGESDVRIRIRMFVRPFLVNRTHKVPKPVFNCPFLQNRTREMGRTFRKACPDISCRMWLATTVI